jgi:hypothetical protein
LQRINHTAPPTSIGTPYIESVVLTIPYYIDASKTITKTDGSREYTLDSIYGPDKAGNEIKCYESGYFMRDTDPMGGFVQPQKYFTDQNSDFDMLKIQIASMTILMWPKTINFSLTQQSMWLLQPIQ